jgi:hypothetical protein
VLIPLLAPFAWSDYIFKTTPTACTDAGGTDAWRLHGGRPYSGLIRRVQEPVALDEMTKMPQTDHVSIIAVRH